MHSVKLRFADAQHLRQGRCVHLYHQYLPILVMNKFPIWWRTNHCRYCILPFEHLPTEEADREVAVICKAPEYYRVRSHVHRRHHYFMYNALDDIGEITRQKCPRNNSPSVQGRPVEH